MGELDLSSEECGHKRRLYNQRLHSETDKHSFSRSHCPRVEAEAHAVFVKGNNTIISGRNIFKCENKELKGKKRSYVRYFTKTLQMMSSR